MEALGLAFPLYAPSSLFSLNLVSGSSVQMVEDTELQSEILKAYEKKSS